MGEIRLEITCPCKRHIANAVGDGEVTNPVTLSSLLPRVMYCKRTYHMYTIGVFLKFWRRAVIARHHHPALIQLPSNRSPRRSFSCAPMPSARAPHLRHHRPTDLHSTLYIFLVCGGCSCTVKNYSTIVHSCPFSHRTEWRYLQNKKIRAWSKFAWECPK